MANQTDAEQVPSTSNEEEFLLTTIDNPFNPFTQWDQWLSFDESKGYNTLGYLARVTQNSHAISEFDSRRAIEIGYATVLKENVYGVHRLFSSKTNAPVPLEAITKR